MIISGNDLLNEGKASCFAGAYFNGFDSAPYRAVYVTLIRTPAYKTWALIVAV